PSQSRFPSPAAAGTAGRCATRRCRPTPQNGLAPAAAPTPYAAPHASTPTTHQTAPHPTPHQPARSPYGYQPTGSRSSPTHPYPAPATTAHTNPTPAAQPSDLRYPAPHQPHHPP